MVDRALRRARRRGRRVRGVVRRVRRAARRHAGRDGRRDGAVLQPRRRVRTGRGIACDPRLGRRARAVRRRRRATSACRSRGSRTRRPRGSQAALDPGLEAGEPARRVGNRHRRRSDLHRVLPRAARRPRHGGARVRRRHDATGRAARRGLPATSRARCSASTDKPFCMLSNLASAVANDEAALLRDDGIPVLEGTASGPGGARGTCSRTGTTATRPPVAAAGAGRRRRPRTMASAPGDRRRASSELEGLALLADYGVPTVRRARRDVGRRGGRGRGRARLAGGAEDGGARRAAQVRRRRRRAWAGRRGRARARLRGPGRRARSAGDRRGDGAARGRARARHRPRPAVRPARARGGGRCARRDPPRPAARAPAAG